MPNENEEEVCCPACEGLGEVCKGNQWYVCGLCAGNGGLTQRALDAANAAAELFHSVVEMVNPNNPHWHNTPRQ